MTRQDRQPAPKAGTPVELETETLEKIAGGSRTVSWDKQQELRPGK